jgi:delta 1-pyrroline-5-carboxylate dehydrogenase
VLHVVRYRRNDLDKLVSQINAAGYGLTLGVHTRIDETIAQVTGSAHVGNLYVNRNMVGAVVGVQPFGGEGLSGTGPKAGGPLYLYRLLASRPETAIKQTLSRHDARFPLDAQLKPSLIQPLDALTQWAEDKPALQAICQRFGELAQTGIQRVLPGPTGERNTWTLLPRESVLCMADNAEDSLTQLAAASPAAVGYCGQMMSFTAPCITRYRRVSAQGSRWPRSITCFHSHLMRLSITVTPISYANCADISRRAMAPSSRYRVLPVVRATFCWSVYGWSVR